MAILPLLIGCRKRSEEVGQQQPEPKPEGVVWVHTFEGTGEEVATGVATDSKGVLVVGWFTRDLARPSGVANTRGKSDMYVARLARDGKLEWLRDFGSAEADYAHAVSASNGLTVVGGEVSNAIEIDDARSAEGRKDEFEMRPPLVFGLDTQGRHAWNLSLGVKESGAVMAIAGNEQSFVVAGHSYGTGRDRDLGAGTIECNDSAGFVSRIDPQGAVAFVRCSNTGPRLGESVVSRIAIGKGQDLAACGLYVIRISFGGPDLRSKDHDTRTLFVAAFGADGATRWQLAAEGQEFSEGCVGVAALDDGAVVVATNADGKLGGGELGKGTVISLRDGKAQWTAELPELLGEERASVAALARDGARLWVAGVGKRGAVVLPLDAATGKAVGEPRWIGDMAPAALAVGEHLYLAGAFTGEVTLAGHAVRSHGDSDAVVLALPR